MKKKVIFIGSPAYSGSTMLDMMLANDPAGMSIGEIIRLILPHRKHYLQERRMLSASSKAWYKIIKEGKENLYKNLFDTYPEVSFFVDSSKDIFWIEQQAAIVKDQGYEVHHILLYKEPADIAQSFIKRNQPGKWEKSWENYYRLYFSLIDDYTVVSYKNLTSDPAHTLRILCQHIDLPFFEEKHHFWEKNHSTLFGNDRTRFHLENVHLSDKSEVAVTQENQYQTIYYLPCQDQGIITMVNARLIANPELQKIWNVLKTKEVVTPAGKNHSSDEPTMTSTEILLRKLRRKNMRFAFRLRAPFI